MDIYIEYTHTHIYIYVKKSNKRLKRPTENDGEMRRTRAEEWRSKDIKLTTGQKKPPRLATGARS